MHETLVRSRPIVLSASTEAQVYGLFALAMGLTVLGVYGGMQFFTVLFGSGLVWLLVIAEFGIILTSGLWMERSPLNYVLFGIFPFLSGLTITPFIVHVLTGYANGGAILINALLSTMFMGLAACVFARTTTWDLGVMGRALFFALLGLVGFALLQIFIPALRVAQVELLFSGAGVVIFGLFTAYDLQRIQMLGARGLNPFLLALSLYLDIFNLFLYILRFMIALSGDRR
ncbi:Bax inhibitor-1 family protein [Candidatus Peregrinibacteria bacterium]|nr:Bax inhibitor-1 family protein [Candidatus Peregrinibacteria bacterium]